MDVKRRFLSYAALSALTLSVGGSSWAVASALNAPLAVPAFAHAAFQKTWDRTDRPVSFGQVQRSYYWGPNPNTGGLLEDYAEGVGGKRLVQYFDKSRMEINDPNADPNNPFFVTNGLLTVELISGKMQVGNQAYEDHAPADIPLASDTDDANAPTYHSFQGVSNTTLGDHPAADTTNQFATATIDKAGNVGADPAKANFPGTQFVHFEPTTKHNVPQAVWDFLNATGPVYDPSTGQNVIARLSDPWFYATGYPISEPYWAKVKIANQPNVDVMIQAFERRVVTYVPSAPAGFQVQMGNIGQHYYDWRYGSSTPPTVPVPTAEPTVVVPPTMPPISAQHTASDFVGTWLNDDAGSNSLGKLWITNSGSNLTIKWFGVCSPGFCDNEQKTVAYTSDPVNVTLDNHTFSISLQDGPPAKLKVVFEGNQNNVLHRAKASDYEGTWLNDDANTGNAAKLWVTANGNNLTVKWFGACGGSLCDNEQKTVAYNFEPFEVKLDNKLFKLALNNLAENRLSVTIGSDAFRFHQVRASDYEGTWVNVDAGTSDIAKFVITTAGNTVKVHFFGACSPLCDNGTDSGVYNGVEPIVVNTTSTPTRTFTITFDNAGATLMRVDVTNAPGNDRKDILKRQ